MALTGGLAGGRPLPLPSQFAPSIRQLTRLDGELSVILGLYGSVVPARLHGVECRSAGVRVDLGAVLLMWPFCGWRR
ncbi:hypothetical protein GCM10020220_107230 [Nonomuraea rubra]